MRQWLVAADDRTGAFEVAALFATVVGPVTVTVGEPPLGSGVVDIASRAMTAADAARAAAALDAVPASWVAHKIDSTLRGNWVAELQARHQVTDRRVVVLPGWPELSRICVAGVVHVDGAPIGDMRAHLPTADMLTDATELADWLGGRGSWAVCDVPDDAAMHAAAAVLTAFDGIVAGPAGPLGAVFATRHPAQSAAGSDRIGVPTLVVCGSAHPVSREQLRRLAVARPDITIMATGPASGSLHHDAVAKLAVDAREHIARRRPAAVLIIGGETAAAVLGSAPRVVAGLAAVGMPYSFDAAGGGATVVTKAGGFGGADALVELLAGENE